MLALLLIAVIVQAPPEGAPATPVSPVVVTAPNGADAKAELAGCMAKGCSDESDMILSLKAADIAFAKGDYNLAHGFLEASLERNHARLGRLPVLQAGLYRADRRVLMHMGERRRAIHAAYQLPAVMRAAYAASDPRVLDARLELGDAQLEAGDLEGAAFTYTNLRRDAEAAGRPGLLGLVDLRRAIGLAASQQKARALALLRELADRPAAGLSNQIAARLLELRIGGRRDDVALGKIISAYQAGAKSVAPAVLVFSPPVDLGGAATPVAVDGMIHRQPALVGDGRPGWVDIGFWITPEGLVEEPEALRSKGDKAWRERVLDAVSRRRYLVSGQGEAARSYRIERFTVVNPWNESEGTGMRIRTRSNIAQLETLDMTEPVAPQL